MLCRLSKSLILSEANLADAESLDVEGSSSVFVVMAGLQACLLDREFCNGRKMKSPAHL